MSQLAIEVTLDITPAENNQEYLFESKIFWFSYSPFLYPFLE